MDDNLNLNKLKEAFAESLAEFMNGKSMLHFSKDVGIPQRTINTWILKKSLPRIEYLVLLSEKFNCSVDYLLGLKND